MIEKILYLNQQFLTDNTNLSTNIDTDLLRPSMITAQDIYISPFLGKVLDAEMKTAVDTDTFTTLQEQLLFHIRMAQSWFTAYQAYVDILFRWTNKSANTPSSDNSASIDRDSLIYVREIAKNNAESYLEILKNFLLDNKDTFPSFYSCYCGGDKQTYTDGIVYKDYNQKYQNPYNRNYPDNDGDNYGISY